MSSFKLSHPNRASAKRWMILVCASLTLGGAIASTTTLPALSQPSNRPSQISQRPSPAVIQAIRQAVKRQFGISKINLVSATEQSWPDGCLGLPSGQEICTTAIVPGWRVEVSDNLQTWVYRSDRTGQTLRLENPDRTVLPPAVASKLIRQVARETKTPAAKLRVVEVKTRVYDGCLGLYRPNQACTKIAISGWQAIITGSKQTFVYHLSQNADRIVQNKTASGAKRTIRVSFEAFGEMAPIATNEIFRSSTSGDLTGRMVSIVLTQDGKITRYQSSPTERFAPVLIKTLSKPQLSAFQETLENRQFPNLNGLSYLTSAALADYPTTTYQSSSAATQFIDLEQKRLPRSLQQVITSWNALIQ